MKKLACCSFVLFTIHLFTYSLIHDFIHFIYFPHFIYSFVCAVIIFRSSLLFRKKGLTLVSPH